MKGTKYNNLLNFKAIISLAEYQCRVGLYIAARFAYTDLAQQLTSKKSPTSVDPGQAVGIHPARVWCKENVHIECGKAPVHIAAEAGNLNILRIFVANNIR